MLLLQWVILNIFLRPFAWISVGLTLWGEENLPRKGPAILAANHDGHLDTMLLVSLFATNLRVQPAGYSFYYHHYPWVYWILKNVFNFVTVPHRSKDCERELLRKCLKCLDEGRIIILYPQGTHRSREIVDSVRKILGKLATERPKVPVFPVFLDGTKKNLAKGEGLFVPYMCDIHVGKSLYGKGKPPQFLKEYDQSFQHLKED